jgi:CRISPR-associated DxTHG motif protein
MGFENAENRIFKELWISSLGVAVMRMSEDIFLDVAHGIDFVPL